jgi:hypothetical protein
MRSCNFAGPCRERILLGAAPEKDGAGILATLNHESIFEDSGVNLGVEVAREEIEFKPLSGLEGAP